MTSTGELLAAFDSAAPGAVVGLHLVGSSVLDDVVFDSDLDVVVELTSPVALTAPADVDVIYVLAGQLSLPVSWASSVSWGRYGSVHTDSRGDLTPVLWEQLNSYSRTVRGSRPSCPVTRAEVEEYCRENLKSYWAPQVERAGQAVRDENRPVLREPLLWVGMGPARLWHTIRTGEIVSKSRAAELAASRWPDLAPQLLGLVAARRDASVELHIEHARAAVELGERVLADV